MKKLILISLAICFLLPSPSFSEAVKDMKSLNGFRGIIWGTLMKDVEKSENWTYSDLETTSAGKEHLVWYYFRGGDKRTIGLAKVTIRYGFWSKSDKEEIFSRVNIFCDSKENWDNLHRALRETFGSNYRNMEYTRITWKWHRSMWEKPWGELWLISKEVEKQIRDFVKNKAKGGIKDF